jgi:2-methylcitrate dehydratase PrpD
MIERSAVPGNRASTMVSVGYQIALAALRAEAMYDVARTDAPFDAGVLDLAAKVKVAGDEALASEFPRRFPAAVAVHAAGRRHERSVTEATGDPGRPLDDAALAAKLRRVARTPLAAADLEDWMGHCRAALADEPAARALAVRYDRQMSA